MSAGRIRVAARTIKRVAHHSGLLALARMARRRERAMILRYHAVTPGSVVDYATPDICLSVSAFRLQMAFVQHAYRVVPLGDLVAGVCGRAPLPPTALAITFDDGYADNRLLAAPVLKRLGLPATIYVATGCVDDGDPFWVAAVRSLVMKARGPIEVAGQPPLATGSAAAREDAARALTRTLVPLERAERAATIAAVATSAGVDLRDCVRGTMLTSEQICELRDMGWTIGAHTVSHGNLVHMAPQEVEAEIHESRDSLEATTGESVVDFCYPNTGGRHAYFSDAVATTLRRAGFRSAVTSRPGAIRAGLDPFFLPRLGVSPRLTDVPDLATAVERQRLVA